MSYSCWHGGDRAGFELVRKTILLAQLVRFLSRKIVEQGVWESWAYSNFDVVSLANRLVLDQRKKGRL